ncbi:hypothetical protein SME10J_50300 (plasmid) [Serratia marcescens]|nr:hypothetical protein SME10J_50300 [Serratia marcescens]
MSHRVMAILGQLTPRLEVYSIDECFCDLTGIPAAQLESLGRRLREEVQRRTHLTVGVGIAPTNVAPLRGEHGSAAASTVFKIQPHLNADAV